MPHGHINPRQEAWKRLCQADPDDRTLMPRVTLEAHCRHARGLLTSELRLLHLEAAERREQAWKRTA